MSKHLILLLFVALFAACKQPVAPMSTQPGSTQFVRTIDTITYHSLTVHAYGVDFLVRSSGYNYGPNYVPPYTDSSVKMVEIEDSLMGITKGDSLSFGFSVDNPSHGSNDPSSGYSHAAQLIRDSSNILRISGSGGNYYQSPYDAGGIGTPSSNSTDSEWSIANIPFSVMPDHSLHGFADLSKLTLAQVSQIVLGTSYSYSSSEGHYNGSANSSASEVTGIVSGAFVEVWVRP